MIYRGRFSSNLQQHAFYLGLASWQLKDEYLLYYKPDSLWSLDFIIIIWSWSSLLLLDCNSKGRELVLALLCPSLPSPLQDLHWPPVTACSHISISERRLKGTFAAFPKPGHCARLCSTGVRKSAGSEHCEAAAVPLSGCPLSRG